MRKRILSSLLAAVMLLSLLPVNALATEEPATDVAFIGEQGYSTLAEAIDAVKNGETITLAAGSHTWIASWNIQNKAVTFQGDNGNEANVSINMTDVNTGQNTSGATLTFEDMTLTFSDTINYRGFQHATKVAYNNCTLNGKQFMYAQTAEFTNCTLTNKNDYSVWTYGAKNVTFTNCTFNSAGRCVYVYNEMTTENFVANVTFNKCTFNDDNTMKEDNGDDDLQKGAVETGSNGENADTANRYNLTFTECTANGFQPNNSNGSTLWGNKHDLDANHLKVVIDGVNKTDAAKIGQVYYPTLQAAIDAATAGATIELVNDVTVTAPVVVNKKVALDLAGHTISNNTDLWKDTKDEDDWSLISVRNGDLTITGNGQLKAKENDCYAADVQGGTLTIENGTYAGNISAVYVFEGTLNVKGGTFSIQQLPNNTNDQRYTLNCFDSNYENGNAKIVVTGGTFDKYNPAGSTGENPAANFLAMGYEAKQTGETWTVSQKKAEVTDTTVGGLVVDTDEDGNVKQDSLENAITEAVNNAASGDTGSGSDPEAPAAPVEVKVPEAPAPSTGGGSGAPADPVVNTSTDLSVYVEAIVQVVEESDPGAGSDPAPAPQVNLAIPVKVDTKEETGTETPKTEDVTVTLDVAAIQQVYAAADNATGDKITLTVEKTTPAEDSEDTTIPEGAKNAAAVYEINLTKGSTKLFTKAEEGSEAPEVLPTATVTIPAPAGVTMPRVYHVEGSTRTLMPSSLVGENIVFTTNHFSTFAVEDGKIEWAGNSLVLEDLVRIRPYFSTSETGAESANFKLQVWTAEDYKALGLVEGEEPDADKTPTKTYEEFNSNNDGWYTTIDGIPAKEMGDSLYMRGVYVDGDMKYATKVMEYSPKIYAENTYKTTNDENLKALVAGLMEYGALAQKYFNYKEDNLMNKFWTENAG